MCFGGGSSSSPPPVPPAPEPEPIVEPEPKDATQFRAAPSNPSESAQAEIDFLAKKRAAAPNSTSNPDEANRSLVGTLGSA